MGALPLVIAMRVAEQQFRKVIGYRQIPLLLSSIANAVSREPIAKPRKLPSPSLRFEGR